MKSGLQKTMLAALSIVLCGIIGFAGTVLGSNGREHNVVKGDTLWDVTQQYLNNPFFWPKVWQYNPQIKNPNLIYPGDIVKIPSPEELAKMGALSQSAASMVSSAPTPVPGRFIVERDLFESSGFIIPKGKTDWEGAIVSTWDEKKYLGERDKVHVNVGAEDGVKEGDLFQVIQVGEEVIHPKTNEKMGKQAIVTGILKINAVDPKISTATIVKAYDTIEVGNKIRAYHPLPLIGADDLTTEDKSIGGVIVQDTRGKSNLASRDTVYLDVGSKDAVVPGDRFLIYRDGVPSQVSLKDAAGLEKSDFPADIMGELVVLNTMDTTSTAVIVEELYEIAPGDRIKYIPRSLPPIKKFDID